MYNIYLEIEKIKEKYNLTGFKQKNGYIFYGELILNHTYENITLKNSLYISMFVPFTFPTDLPIVRDITKKIESEFHKNKNDILCLACDAEIHYELKRNNSVTICDFIEKFLIPYLYSYTYYKKYNKIPYGQRSHGFQGVIEFYMDYFEMRLEQCNVLEDLHLEVNKIREMPAEARIIADFVDGLIGNITEGNSPDQLIEQLEDMIVKVKTSPLPVTHEELEKRAILYHVLAELEAFLLHKKRFVDKLDEQRKRMYWDKE